MTETFARLRTALSDRYAIEREIGQGGMAVVYLAEDRKHGRRVALKVLEPVLAQAIGPERFLKEIEIVARLTHPGILPLHDSGDADGLLYYVMPYVEDESLRALLDREGRLPVDDVIGIVGDVAGALSYAHERGVIHRDIKPGNILLLSGRSVVSDFGIARAVDAEGKTRLTETGLAIGSPGYMSPEQAMGDRALDERSDVYSLGCVAFEMLGGEPPFKAPTPQAVLVRVLMDPPTSLRELRPEIAEGVERVIERALAKEPEARFRSAREFADALAEANTAQAIAEDTRRTRRARRRHTVLGTLGVALLAAAGWWGATLLGSPAIDRLAVLPFTSLMNDPEQEYFVQGMHDALISELAQAGVAVIARTSVMQYRDTEKPVREIARELNVDAVIEASVNRAGDSVEIDARLIDASTEELVWSGSYPSDVRNVLALYREVTRSIAVEIRQRLTPEQEARLAEARPVEPQAYQAYLRGMFHSQRWTPEDWTTSLEYFETALEIDRDYAPAYVGIAQVWGMRSQAGLASANEARERRGLTLERALALDSTLAEAHAVAAATRTWGYWDWEGGERGYRRAIELNLSDGVERLLFGHLLTILGRWEEGAEEAETGLELDPLNPFVQGLHATQMTMARRYEDAIENFQEMLRRNPGAGFGRAAFADALFILGRSEEAFRVTRENYELFGARDVVAALDRGYEEGGYRGAYRLAADTLAVRASAEDTSNLAFRVAVLLILAGETEEALDWLEQAFEARDSGMAYIGVTPVFEPLHDHPRFRDLARRMNLRILNGPYDSS